MKVTKQIVSVAMIALVAFACKNTDYKKTKDGLLYTVYSAGSGEKIALGNIVRFHATTKLGDSLISSTYATNSAQWLPIPKDAKEAVRLEFFLAARKGDSILLLQSVDSILARNPQAAQDSLLVRSKGKNIKTYIKIVDIYKDQDAAAVVQEKENLDAFLKNPEVAQQKAKDEAAIEAYLKANNITTRRSPWGVYVQTLTPGSGNKPKIGEFITLKYTGKLLTGEVFDSGTYPLQIGARSSIQGFEDGAKQLSKGEKAVMFIPSVVGYGAQGNPPKIGPNQNMMFEVEVVDISNTAPAPQAPPVLDSTRK